MDLHAWGLAALVIAATASLLGVVYMAVVRLATDEARALGHEQERADENQRNAAAIARLPVTDNDAVDLLRAKAAAQREREAADDGGAKGVRGGVFQKHPVDRA